MDGLIVMTSTVFGAKNLLCRYVTALIWAVIEFGSDKLFSTVIVKGKSINTTPFSVLQPSDQSELSSSITSTHSRSIKFLSYIIDDFISYRSVNRKSPELA